jgi:hypothetical protein
MHLYKCLFQQPARSTLQKALEVVEKIKELNGGNPWPPVQLAKAFDLTVKSEIFYYLISGSRSYGLTKGTARSSLIEIDNLGHQIAYATDPETEMKKKREAFLNVPIFKDVLKHYKGSQLPEMKYLANTLETKFELQPEFHEEFAELFRANCNYLGIEQGGTSGEIVEDRTVTEDIPHTVVVGEPKKSHSNTLKAFVIMPFTEKGEARATGFFHEVLNSLITPAGIAAGFQVETANRQGSDVIQSTIINDLLDADLVIADLTDHNPNVLFELGLRMAEGRPIALIKASGTGRVFDVDNMLRVTEYSANLWPSTVVKDLTTLTQHIKAAWENRDKADSYIKILRRKALE